MIPLFKIVSLLEGLSYVLLLLFAVPFKYLLGNDFYVQILGMPHGVLFLLYLCFSFLLKKQMKWGGGVFLVVLLASIVPFGTFYVNKKHL